MESFNHKLYLYYHGSIIDGNVLVNHYIINLIQIAIIHERYVEDVKYYVKYVKYEKM